MSTFSESWVHYQSLSPRDRRAKHRSPRRKQGQGICLRLDSVFGTCEFSLTLWFYSQSILGIPQKLRSLPFTTLEFMKALAEMGGTGIQAPKIDSYLIQIHQRKLLAFI